MHTYMCVYKCFCVYVISMYIPLRKYKIDAVDIFLRLLQNILEETRYWINQSKSLSRVCTEKTRKIQVYDSFKCHMSICTSLALDWYVTVPFVRGFYIDDKF